MARRKKSRSSRALSQAKLTSRLRFLPEAEALAGLLRDEDVNYRVGVRTEKGIAAGITQGLREATPLVAQNYGRALESSANNAHYASSKLAPLGASADDIKAAAFAEQAGAHRRISESGAGTLKEYAGRLADTKAGEAFAVRNLGNVRAGNIGKIRAKQGSLARQRGMFTQAQYETFLDKLDDAALDQAKFRETKRSHRANEGIAQQNANTAAENARREAAKKKGGPTREQRVAAREKWEKGVALAPAFLKWGKSKDKLTGKIVNVPPASEAELVKILTVKLGSATIAKAAAQQAIYRGVGPKTRKLMARRYGVHLKGFPKRRPARRRSAIPGVNLVR